MVRVHQGARGGITCVKRPHAIQVRKVGLIKPVERAGRLKECDRNRESIMIGPSKINNGGITFTLFAHTNREYGSTLAQECGKPQTAFLFFFVTVPEAPPATAPEFSALKQCGGAKTKIRMATW
mgnify:CR=1 FL=1